ncbi:MarR family transcriptional regulator, partial [Aneurinibacillus terranovensis]|uniref:MarR family transcriptional regulator n=1 Tax=Aneurinibacillus terranovensis TaxID=278991 RepID=UPI00040F3FC4
MNNLEPYIERLQTAFRITMRKLGPELSEHMNIGLTGPQFFILQLLSKRRKCMVTELAEEMGVKPSAITAMIDRLDKNGLVVRQRDEIDRRARISSYNDVNEK